MFTKNMQSPRISWPCVAHGQYVTRGHVLLGVVYIFPYSQAALHRITGKTCKVSWTDGAMLCYLDFCPANHAYLSCMPCYLAFYIVKHTGMSWVSGHAADASRRFRGGQPAAQFSHTVQQFHTGCAFFNRWSLHHLIHGGATQPGSVPRCYQYLQSSQIIEKSTIWTGSPYSLALLSAQVDGS